MSKTIRPTGDTTVTRANSRRRRLSLEAIVSALVVVLAHIISSPRHENSVSDLGVCRYMVHILQSLAKISKDDGLATLQNLCVELYLRAEKAASGREFVTTVAPRTASSAAEDLYVKRRLGYGVLR